MNTPSRLVLYLVVAELASASFAQTPEHYVAQVANVTGACRECPHGHPEHSRAIDKGTQLAADDDVQCDGHGFMVASYTGNKTYFRIDGPDWQPVGMPGASENSDSSRPREGRVAYNTLDDAMKEQSQVATGSWRTGLPQVATVASSPLGIRFGTDQGAAAAAAQGDLSREVTGSSLRALGAGPRGASH